MLDRFNRAKQAQLTYNKNVSRALHAYLIKNNNTWRIFYVQNVTELQQTMVYLLPHIQEDDIDYTKNSIMDKYEIVMESNDQCDGMITSGQRYEVVRAPGVVLGLH